MKKYLTPAIAAAAMAMVSSSAFAADGTITFTGQIEDMTCTVTGGAGTDGGAQDFTVALPTVQKTALSAAGQRAGDTPFSVIIGGAGETGCTDGKTAKLWFELGQSAQIDQASGRLNNLGTATEVQVNLLNSEGLDINLATNSNPSTQVIAGNTATLNYIAQYYATGAAEAGTVDTNVVYSVAYN